jgi:hypothetical protein
MMGMMDGAFDLPYSRFLAGVTTIIGRGARLDNRVSLTFRFGVRVGKS